MMDNYFKVERQRVAIIAPGPSLCKEQIDMLRESEIYTIAVGDAGRVLYPEAHVLYHADAAWWYHYRGCPDVTSVRACIEKLTYSNVAVFQRSMQQTGIDLNFPYLVTGNNSGYQAINLAMYCYPKEIILVGFDMQKKDGNHNIIGDHPKKIKRPADFNLFAQNISSLAPVLDNAGVKVYNCSLDSALTCFEKKELQNVL